MLKQCPSVKERLMTKSSMTKRLTVATFAQFIIRGPFTHKEFSHYCMQYILHITKNFSFLLGRCRLVYVLSYCQREVK